MDEIINDIIKEIEKARQYAIKSQKQTDKVFNELDKLDIDLDEIPSEAENADNLSDAISCYIDYGEFGIENIREELLKALDQM